MSNYSESEPQLPDDLPPEEHSMKKIKPRKARTAYEFFTQDKKVRQKLIKETPNVGFWEMCRFVREEWEKITEDQRIQYTRMAEDDRTREANEKQVYEEERRV